MSAANWSSRCPCTSQTKPLPQARLLHSPIHGLIAHRCVSRSPVGIPAARQHLWSSHVSNNSSNSRRSWSLHVVQVAKGLLDVIEGLKQQADALQDELSEAGKAAEAAAKRSRRLAQRSQQLQAYALEHVMLGDEAGARSALLQKASVADALAAASRRAEANIALARKLEDVLTEKQLQVLKLIRQAKEQADAGVATVAAATVTAAGSSGLRSRTLKRSGSVGWDSSTMHASSDALDVELQCWSTASKSVGGSDGEGQSTGAVNEYGSTSRTNGRHCSSSSTSSSRTNGRHCSSTSSSSRDRWR